MNKNSMISLLAILLALGYIPLKIMEYTSLRYFMSFLALLFIIISFRELKNSTIKIVCFLLLMILMLILFTNINIKHIFTDGLLINLPIISIITLTPLLSLAVQTGRYQESLKVIFQKVLDKPMYFYSLFFVLSHVLTVVLNIGSVLINLYLVQSFKVKSKRLISNSINRGFTTTLLWSPFAGMVILVVDALKIDWSEMILYSFPFIIISFIVALMIDLPEIKKEIIFIKSSNKSDSLILDSSELRNHYKNVFELAFILVLIMSFVLMFSKVKAFDISVIISILSVTFPVSWMIIKKRVFEFYNKSKEYAENVIPSMKSEYTLFIVAGAFGSSFANSSLNNNFMNLITNIGSYSIFIVSVLISLIVVITGIIGIHPIVILTLIALGINPLEVGINPLLFGVLLLISVSISNVVSPVTAVNNLLANALNETVESVSLKGNYIYGLILLLILPLYILILHIFIIR